MNTYYIKHTFSPLDKPPTTKFYSGTLSKLNGVFSRTLERGKKYNSKIEIESNDIDSLLKNVNESFKALGYFHTKAELVDGDIIQSVEILIKAQMDGGFATRKLAIEYLKSMLTLPDIQDGLNAILSSENN